jgi:hypothetical protein
MKLHHFPRALHQVFSHYFIGYREIEYVGFHRCAHGAFLRSSEACLNQLAFISLENITFVSELIQLASFHPVTENKIEADVKEYGKRYHKE